MARCSSASFLSVSAPAFIRARAASPCPSEMAKSSIFTRDFSVYGEREVKVKEDDGSSSVSPTGEGGRIED